MDCALIAHVNYVRLRFCGEHAYRSRMDAYPLTAHAASGQTPARATKRTRGGAEAKDDDRKAGVTGGGSPARGPRKTGFSGGSLGESEPSKHRRTAAASGREKPEDDKTTVVEVVARSRGEEAITPTPRWLSRVGKTPRTTGNTSGVCKTVPPKAVETVVVREAGEEGQGAEKAADEASDDDVSGTVGNTLSNVARGGWSRGKRGARGRGSRGRGNATGGEIRDDVVRANLNSVTEATEKVDEGEEQVEESNSGPVTPLSGTKTSRSAFGGWGVARERWGRGRRSRVGIADLVSTALFGYTASPVSPTSPASPAPKKNSSMPLRRARSKGTARRKKSEADGDGPGAGSLPFFFSPTPPRPSFSFPLSPSASPFLSLSPVLCTYTHARAHTPRA